MSVLTAIPVFKTLRYSCRLPSDVITSRLATTHNRTPCADRVPYCFGVGESSLGSTVTTIMLDLTKYWYPLPLSNVPGRFSPPQTPRLTRMVYLPGWLKSYRTLI